MLLVVSRPKVLVVDDEENIRFLVGSALTVHELEVQPSTMAPMPFTTFVRKR